jgi:alcohol dehydrogenase (cytochrome c)
VTGGDSAHRGYIHAFDAKTGRLAWRFWTIPGPREKGNETWAGESWKYGGGSTWMTGSFDAELNLIYWSVGNPAADFYGGSRKGDNLYTDSVVALDADTGKLKWHFQQIPHDVWDFDTAYENILLDLPVDGKPRKLLVNINKGGFTWVLDRVTGEFVSGYPIVKNINWIQGVDKQGRLVGRNEPVVGESKILCPSIGGLFAANALAVHDCHRVVPGGQFRSRGAARGASLFRRRLRVAASQRRARARPPGRH